MSVEERRCATCGHEEGWHREYLGDRGPCGIVARRSDLYVERCGCTPYVPEERRSGERRGNPIKDDGDRLGTRLGDRRASSPVPAGAAVRGEGVGSADLMEFAIRDGKKLEEMERRVFPERWDGPQSEPREQGGER